MTDEATAFRFMFRGRYSYSCFAPHQSLDGAAPESLGERPADLVSDDAIIIRVTPDPKPKHAAGNIHAERPVGDANSNRNEASDTFEMKGRVSLILLKKFEVLLGQFLYLLR
jgi:hypothetical protein